MTERPFYGSFAWAYDHLIDRPVAPQSAAVASILGARGVSSDARLLDAGCGTGRHAVELAARGYRVTGVDRSPELVAVARRRPVAAGARFVVGDLAALPLRRACGGVLCRGVLNDVLEDETRAAIMRALAGVLLPAGVLVLDVRDWEATVRVKTRTPVDEWTVATERGMLTFRSETRLDPATRRMLISERHVLVSDRETRSEPHEFVMRCWTPEELAARLAEAGFEAIHFRAGYEADASPDSSDRIVAIASRRPA